MIILIAPDKFKGTLSAAEAARAMADGTARALKARGVLDAGVLLRPLADGGEGSHACLRELRPELEEHVFDTVDANGTKIQASYLSAGNGTGRHVYLETARVIGLEMPGARDRSILNRSTAGIGRWLRAVLDAHAQNHGDAALHVHLFLGGSCTSDAGFGIARELGLRFFAGETALADFGDLDRLSITHMQLAEPPGFPLRFRVYTDVQNPLDGPDGAAHLFGPQKGASAAEVEILERRIAALGNAFEQQAGRPGSARIPGSGAAGGLALPLQFIEGASTEFVSGIDFFLGEAQIVSILEQSPPAFVLTGEGATDRGSLQGKVIEGLRRLVERSAPDAGLVVLSGRIPDADREALRAAGFSALFDTIQFCGEEWPLAPAAAAQRLTVSTEQALADLLQTSAH